MARRSTLVCFLALLALTACSSGGSGKDADSTTTTKSGTKQGSSTTPSTVKPGNWNKDAAADLDALMTKLRREMPGQCKDPEPVSHDDYVRTASIIRSDVPLAVAQCTTIGETVEFSEFPSKTARAKFIRERVELLCRRAKSAKFPLAGLHWVAGPTWSAQPDTQGVGRVLAQTLGGNYQGVPCPGMGQLNWEPGGVARADAVAAKLAANPRIVCSEYVLLDHAQYAHDPAYVKRLPAAYARCNGAGGSVIWIASFSDKSVDRDKFVETETKGLCATQSGVQAAVGDGFAVITNQSQLAALAAIATGARSLPPAC